jgi:imidazolonepropionase
MLTLAGSSQTPKTREQMRELGIIHDGAVAIREGKIVAVGKTPEVTKAFRGEYVLNAKGKTVLPGFVDPHTHLVFSGSREDEHELFISGTSFMELVNGGEAIFTTAKETRRTRLDKLVEMGLERLDLMLAHGTTTVEVKSGYGFSPEEELRLLKATKRINQLHSTNVVPTFFGAHAVPLEYRSNPEDYVNLVIDEMIPKLAQAGLADFCDVWCDRGFFSMEQAKRILTEGKNVGLKPKVHADHLNTMGGAELAAEVDAVSAAPNFTSTQGAKAMAAKGVVAELLPAATFSLMMNNYPDARMLIVSGRCGGVGNRF